MKRVTTNSNNWAIEEKNKINATSARDTGIPRAVAYLQKDVSNAVMTKKPGVLSSGKNEIAT